MGNKWNLTGAIIGLGTFRKQGSAPGFVIGAVQAKGLCAWGEGTMAQAGAEPWLASLQPNASMRMGTYPDYAYTAIENGQPAARTTNLMLIAGGTPETGLKTIERIVRLLK